MRNIEFRDRFNNSKEYIGTRIIVSLDKKTFELKNKAAFSDL